MLGHRSRGPGPHPATSPPRTLHTFTLPYCQVARSRASPCNLTTSHPPHLHPPVLPGREAPGLTLQPHHLAPSTPSPSRIARSHAHPYPCFTVTLLHQALSKGNLLLTRVHWGKAWTPTPAKQSPRLAGGVVGSHGLGHGGNWQRGSKNSEHDARNVVLSQGHFVESRCAMQRHALVGHSTT